MIDKARTLVERCNESALEHMARAIYECPMYGAPHWRTQYPEAGEFASREFLPAWEDLDESGRAHAMALAKAACEARETKP